MKCENCGANLKAQASSCAYCGSERVLKEAAAPPQQTVIYNIYQAGPDAPTLSHKNKWVAFALCLVFGAWGAHKFYVGKIGMGVIYLFTFGLFGIGWLIDLIVIISGTSTDSRGLRLA